MRRANAQQAASYALAAVLLVGVWSYAALAEVPPSQGSSGGGTPHPGSSTDEGLARYDGTEGALQDSSSVTLSDAGVLTVNGGSLTVQRQDVPTTGVTISGSGTSLSFVGGSSTHLAFKPGSGETIRLDGPSRMIDSQYVGWSSTNSFGGAEDTRIGRGGAAGTFYVRDPSGGADATLRAMDAGNSGYAAITSQTHSSFDGTNTIWQEIRGRTTVTDETTVSLCSIPVADLEGVGGVIAVSVYATDGTDVQVHSEEWRYAAVFKSGTLTSEITTTGAADDADADSAGTLTATVTLVEVDPNVLHVRINCNTTLTTTTFYASWRITNDLGGMEHQ